MGLSLADGLRFCLRVDRFWLDFVIFCLYWAKRDLTVEVLCDLLLARELLLWEGCGWCGWCEQL